MEPHVLEETPDDLDTPEPDDSDGQQPDGEPDSPEDPETVTETVQPEPDELRSQADLLEQAAHEQARALIEAAEQEANALRVEAERIIAERQAERDAAALEAEQQRARVAYGDSLADWSAALAKVEEAEAARQVVVERQAEAASLLNERLRAVEAAVLAGADLVELADAQGAAERQAALTPLVTEQLQRAAAFVSQAEALEADVRASVDAAWRRLVALRIEGEFDNVRPPWIPGPKPSLREFLAELEQSNPTLFAWMAANASAAMWARAAPDEPDPKPKSHVSVVRS